MKLFVIHRFKDRKPAKAKLKKIATKESFEVELTFLNSSGNELWKNNALNAMDQAEAVVIFNRTSCDESENASWEIEKAKSSGKDIVEINVSGDNQEAVARLKSLYELSDEFDACFSSQKEHSLELYKMMIASSESLIQRRQKTNAFFITVIGSLLTIAGFIIKTGAVDTGTYGILSGFSVVGLLVCNSWRNLIDNYGKLNKAKFDVILRLEKDLGAQMYSAEWVSLGKGLRPKKYKSFTSTEKDVPLYFGLLIIALTIGVFIEKTWGYLSDVIESIKCFLCL